ncbi:crk-like protein isoform X2 [Sycon ciliatum]|uniref:crk-like protein isoform X2 n=1 Tax=Sycon ciliatum TaxID=27933 RepID=UPI0031F609EB
MQRYDQYPWYHGKLDRQRAEDVLRNKRTGTYLVRDSSTIPGDYVLSVRENASLGALYSHYIINHRGNLYIIGDQTFMSLPEVIEFYHDHYLDTTVLTEIADRQQQGQTLVQPRPKEGEPLPPPVRVTMPAAPEPAPASNGQVICTVKALFKFQSDDSEDLPFEKDDIMYIISKDEDAWWTARHSVSGRQGSIPVPYVEVEEASQAPPPRPEEHRAHATRLESTGAQGSERQGGRTQSPQQPAPGAAGVGGGGGAGTPSRVRALAILDRYASAYDNTALSFKAGETITVLRQNENGLWEGELNGRQGHFPFTHVQVIDDGDQAATFY